MKFPSWVELHGAFTHFPIALLFAAAAFEFGAAWPRQPDVRRDAWRATSLNLLVLAVVCSIPALATGYFTGRTFSHPPVQFQLHWIAAVTSSLLALALLLWRLAARDVLTAQARTASGVLMLAGVAAISFTGYLGGQMVFGDGESTSEVSPAPHPTQSADPQSVQKLGAAAGKMEVAAGKLDAATGKFASAAQQSQTAKPATPQVIVKTVPVPAQTDEAAAKLERVAARFEQTAKRLEQLATSLNSRRDNSTQFVPLPSGRSKSGAPGSATAPTPSATTASRFDAKLLALGETVFRSEENGCLNCHTFEGRGRRRGPDLTNAGARQPDVDWHVAHLKDPKSKVTGSKMPAYDEMPADQINALAAFLASQR